VSVDVNTGPLI